MKIFIAADLEGATGVVHNDQLMPDGRGYAEAQRMLTADINAVIDGVRRVDPGAEFLVGDGHATMRNVLLGELHPSARLVVGGARVSNKPLCQLEGINATFNAAILVGYHSKAGTPGGLLAHTYVGSLVRNWILNGKPVGEVEMNAAILGSFGVPLVLVSGNSCLEPEVREFNTDIPFVTTKTTLGPTAAICCTPKETQQLLTNAAEEAISRQRQIYPVSACTIEIQTYRREQCEKACTAAETERISDSAFRVLGTNAADAFRKAWRACATVLEETPFWLT